MRFIRQAETTILAAGEGGGCRTGFVRETCFTDSVAFCLQAIGNCVNEQEVYERFNPTLLIAIGSGGYIPGRMLRTFLKAKCGRSLPLQTIGLVLYDDDNDKYDFKTAKVRKTQVCKPGASNADCSHVHTM